MKKVVFAYRYGLLGGVSAQLLNRFPAFSKAFDVHVLYVQDHGMSSRFPDGRARVVATPEDRAAAIDDLQPDWLLVIDTPEFIDAWHSVGSPGKLVVEVHTTTRNKAYLEQLSSDAGIAAFVTVSEYMRDTLEADGLDAIAPIYTVPNCLDQRWFTPIDAPVVDRRPLLWVGKLDAHKRWRAGLDLIDDVLRGPGYASVTPLIVGGYTAPGTEAQQFLRRMYASPALRQGLWWPYLAYERMARLYRSVGQSGGGLVLTTRNESFGMSVAEALLMECPVIAPRVGALPELLTPQALYEPDDWEDARHKVSRMLDDPAFRSQIVHSTRERVRDLVDPSRALAAFTTALEQVEASA